jgi:hypothetical protein
MTTESSTHIETTGQAGTQSLRSFSRLTYTTCYMISYGVVYAAVFLAKSLPQNNPIMEGLIDGGRAAFDAVNENKGITLAPFEAAAPASI